MRTREKTKVRSEEEIDRIVVREADERVPGRGPYVSGRQSELPYLFHLNWLHMQLSSLACIGK